MIQARLHLVECALRQALHSASSRATLRHSLILCLHDADGHCGWGEAAPWPGFDDTPLTQIAADLQALLDALPEPEAIEAWQQIAAGLRSLAARAALLDAWADLSARRAGQPLAHWLIAALALPGPALSQVASSALIEALDPELAVSQALRAQFAGHRALKFKLGVRSLAEDCARLAAVRAAVGPRLALRGDANGAWDEAQARVALEMLAPLDLEFVEQPVAKLDALLRLSRVAALPVAIDESLGEADALARVIAAGSIKVLVLKPAQLGGVIHTLALSAQARAAGLRCVYSHSFESMVGWRHLWHAAAAAGDAEAVHGLDAQLRADFSPVALAGRFELPAQPGIGAIA